MRYKLYEAPSNLFKNSNDRFANTLENLRAQQRNSTGDYISIYTQLRDLLRTPDISVTQEYAVRMTIYQLFIEGFCRSLGGGSAFQKFKRFFDNITRTVKPVGPKGNGMEFGNNQLRFWTEFIEAYNWDEILNSNNVFKKVLNYIVDNGGGV